MIRMYCELYNLKISTETADEINMIERARDGGKTNYNITKRL